MTSDTSSIRSHGGIRESRRLSIEEYYGRIFERPTNRDTVQEPPDYDLALEGLRVPPSAVKISLRKDEGYEILPSYTCSIMIQAVFQRKMELESAVQRADDRNWSKVFLKIQGTALQVYKVKNLGMFSKEYSDPILNPDLPPYLRAGDLLRTYSLQYAEVGIAADYVKYIFSHSLHSALTNLLDAALSFEYELRRNNSFYPVSKWKPSSSGWKCSPQQSISRPL
jgi:hypothetical protein